MSVKARVHPSGRTGAGTTGTVRPVRPGGRELPAEPFRIGPVQRQQIRIIAEFGVRRRLRLDLQLTSGGERARPRNSAARAAQGRPTP